jgi:hypothetical protein
MAQTTVVKSFADLPRLLSLDDLPPGPDEAGYAQPSEECIPDDVSEPSWPSSKQRARRLPPSLARMTRRGSWPFATWSATTPSRRRCTRPSKSRREPMSYTIVLRISWPRRSPRKRESQPSTSSPSRDDPKPWRLDSQRNGGRSSDSWPPNLTWSACSPSVGDKKR